MKVFLLMICLSVSGAALAEEPAPGPQTFAAEVDMRLSVPAAEQKRYARRLATALAEAGVAEPSVPSAEYFALVDRSPRVQAVFLYWRSPLATWEFIGASPVSTGLPGEFEHFLTPLGAFEHTPANPDFRAEGTLNELGLRGYGVEGMRVYDFGWVSAERTWEKGEKRSARSLMRLQMHATDPERLEPRLGERHSEGCIRIPATLNTFLDRHGILDADYEELAREGRAPRVLLGDREPTATPGRWLLVVDSQRRARPAWSPRPQTRAGSRARPASSATTSSSSTC